MSNSKFNVRLLTEIAFMAALAFIISLIPNTVYGWIIVEIACIPILILSFRRGLTAGLVGGLIWGILSMITGHAYILTLSQAFPPKNSPSKTCTSSFGNFCCCSS